MKTHDTIIEEVCQFFENNPEEELTIDDIAQKFNVRRWGLVKALQPAVQDNRLAFTKTPYETIYRLGKQVETVLQAPTQEQEPVASQRYTPPIKLSDIQIDDNIPFPETPRRNLITFQMLLGKLKPGQSASLPIKSITTLQRAVALTHKAKFGRYAVRQLPDTQQVRVWRTS